MKIKLKELSKTDLDNLYTFLKCENFPYLPEQKQAESELLKEDNHIFLGLDSKTEEIVLFLCFAERNGHLYFDIACDEKYRKRWASKEIMRFIFKTAFKTLGYKEFIVESLNQNARNVVEKFGFKKIKGFFYSLRCDSKVVSKYFKGE